MAENQYTNTEDTVEHSPLEYWHKPEIFRVDIKRTLYGLGSGFDGFTGSSSPH